MIVIYAEKPDVGNKIAAALDKITLSGGKTVTFETLKANEKAVKSQQHNDGFLKINFRGDECYVTWGYGHLCELKQAKDYDEDYKNWNKMPIPFIPSNYEVKVKEDAKKQFKLVKDLFNKSDLIINATDYDREGDLIFALVYETAKCKVPFQRAILSSQTKTGFLDAFADLKDSSFVKPMTDAGKGRNIADYDIGNNMTALMTTKCRGTDVLSIGRVQTPTLNLLVKRELAIRDFKPEAYYTITGTFTTGSKEKYNAEYEKKKIAKKEDADKIFAAIKGNNGIITDVKKDTTKKAPPHLYSLSSLQMDTNSEFGFSMQKTLDIAQQLYEGGYTTYPRTDSQYLTEDMEPVINKLLDVLAKLPEYEKFITGKARRFNKPYYFDDSKVSSHFAIIPTGSIPKGLSSDQQKVYDLIAKSVIMMLYTDAIIEKTTIVTDVNGNKFNASGNVVKDPQWMALAKTSKDEFLPNVEVGDEVSGTYKINEKQTQPPKRYNEKSLLAAMISAGKDLEDEDLKKFMASAKINGIGTEATRAGIIEKLVERGYVARDKKSIYATDKGINLIKILPLEEIKSAELTASWESKLSDIADGKKTLESFIEEIEKLTCDWCAKIEKKLEEAGEPMDMSATSLKCPICGNAIRKLNWGWGCSNYKSEEPCKFAISSEIAGKPITDADVNNLLEKGETGTIKGFKSKSGKKFDAKLKLEKVQDENGKLTQCKVAFAFDNPATENTTHACPCPICGSKVNGTRWAWKCSNDDCNMSINYEIASKKLTDEQITTLLKTKKSPLISGFKSKKGTNFKAYLVMDDSGKISFEFPPRD